MTELEVKVVDKVSYILKEDAVCKLDVNEEEPDQGEIEFYTKYYKQEDEDGYNPPKYLVLDGVLDEMTNHKLKKMGLDKEWECADLDYDNFTMITVYVLPETKEELTREELKQYKRTNWYVPVVRKKRMSQIDIDKESDPIDNLGVIVEEDAERDPKKQKTE